MKTGLIYIIKNNINNKVYIGQTTVDMQTRFNQHCKNSVLKSRHYKLYNAIKKYGKHNFHIELLESNIPLEQLNQKEIEYIEKYNSFLAGYNSTKGGDGRTINKKYDEAVIVNLYKQGRTTVDISKIYNVHAVTITRVLHKLNVPVRCGGKKYDRFGKQFIKDYESGMYLKDMAVKYGVNEKSIRRHCIRLGIKLRGKGNCYRPNKDSKQAIKFTGGLKMTLPDGSTIEKYQDKRFGYWCIHWVSKDFDITITQLTEQGADKYIQTMEEEMQVVEVEQDEL